MMRWPPGISMLHPNSLATSKKESLSFSGVTAEDPGLILTGCDWPGVGHVLTPQPITVDSGTHLGV